MKEKMSYLILAILFAYANMVQAQSVSYAKSLIQQGRYLDAAKLLRPLADGGNAEAQAMAAQLFFDGKGVDKNDAQGVKYATLAANQGNGDGVLALYYYYHDTKDDLVKAYSILSQYYSRLNTQASTEEIGFIYAKALIRGEGVAKNEEKGWEIMGEGKEGSIRKQYYDGHVKKNYHYSIPNTFEKYGYQCTIMDNNEIKIEIPYYNRSRFEGHLSIPGTVKYNGTTYTITVIDASSMQLLKITSLTIPNTIKGIGGMAFWYCEELRTVNIPANTTYIGDDAFEGCTSLSNINVASGNPNFCAVDNVLFTKDKSILKCYPGGKTGSSYTVPSTVTKIEGAAFRESNLISVTITNPDIKIDNYAFLDCNSLTTVQMPTKAYLFLPKNTFKGCDNLKEIKVLGVDGSISTKSAEPYKQK